MEIERLPEDECEGLELNVLLERGLDVTDGDTEADRD